MAQLLARGHGPAPRDAWGATPLHYAATRNRAGATSALLRGGADPGAEDEDGLRPAHWAAANGGVAVLERLLAAAPGEVGAPAGGSGRTPLHCACRTGQVVAARVLAAKGAALGAPDAGGATPLHEAARAGSAALAEFLVAAGADPGARDASGCAPADVTQRAALRRFLEERREAAEAEAAALRPSNAPPPGSEEVQPRHSAKPPALRSPTAPLAPRPALGRVALGGARPKAQALKIPVGAPAAAPPVFSRQGAETSTPSGGLSSGAPAPQNFSKRRLLSRTRGPAPLRTDEGGAPRGGTHPPPMEGAFDRQLKMDSTTRRQEFDERRDHRKNVLDNLAPHLRRKWGSKLRPGPPTAGAPDDEAPGNAQQKFLEKYGLGETAFTAEMWRVKSSRHIRVLKK